MQHKIYQIDIDSAFKTKDLMQEYEKNSMHLSQIANLKSGITASIEARVLNTLAFILSISQLVELFNNIKETLINANLEEFILINLHKKVFPGGNG